MAKPHLQNDEARGEVIADFAIEKLHNAGEYLMMIFWVVKLFSREVPEAVVPKQKSKLPKKLEETTQINATHY